MKTRWAFLLTLALCGIWILPASAQQTNGQDEGLCGDCDDFYDEPFGMWLHSAWSEAILLGISKGHGWHDPYDLGDCVDGGHTQRDCRPWTDFELSQFVKGLETGNLRYVEKQLPLFQQHVILNSQRSSIQLISCSGKVFAHIPVSSNRLAAITSLVTRARSFGFGLPSASISTARSVT